MEFEHPLLLITSVIFDNPNLIDCIRQSCIDLNETTDGELVENLLTDAIDYLFKDISYDTANELIALILKCFVCLSTDPFPFLNILFEKSKTNSYSIISFVSVFSYLINNKENLDLSNFYSFIDDALKEIQPQLQNQNKLCLFNKDIPLQFRDDLIFDLLLSTKPTEELLSHFSDFYSSKEIRDNKKFPLFCSKISEAGLSTSIHTSLLMEQFDDNESSDIIDDSEETQNNTKEEETLDKTNEVEEVDFITEFLSTPNPEKDKLLKKKLINKILTEKTNLLGYFQIIFENLPDTKTTPSELMSYFSNEYEMSKEDFVKVLDNVLVFHPTEKVFVEQPKYKPLNLEDSEFNRKIINNLFSIVRRDSGNFQAFYCLECIANSFPFIFASNPHQVFDIVLPAFDNFKFIFDKKEKDENDVKKRKKIDAGKAAISAISFLLFALNSTKVFDAFILWFFENIKNFTLSQIMCMLLVFIKTFNSDIFQYIATLLIKYDFFEKISFVLPQKVPKNLFGLNFNYLLYAFLKIQHKLSDILSTFETISIDVNKKRENLLYEASGRRITHSYDYLYLFKSQLLYLDESDMKKLDPEPFCFFDHNESFRPSFTVDGREQNASVNQAQVSEFIQLYKSMIAPKEAAENVEFPDPKASLPIRNVRTLILREPWIIRYIMVEKKFPLLVEHKKMLSEAYSALLDEKNDNDDDDDEINGMPVNKFDKESYFESYRENPEFLKNLIERMNKTYYRPGTVLAKYFESIPFGLGDEFVLRMIDEHIKYIDQNLLYYRDSTFIEIQNNFLLLEGYVKAQKKSESFTNTFFKEVGNDLVNIVLKPQYRQNKLVLRYTYQLLSFFKNYPVQVFQLIGFMILANDKYLKKSASKLCFRFKDEQLSSCQILNDAFMTEVSSENPQITFISNILRSTKYVGFAYQNELLDVLKSSLQKCQEKIQNGEDEKEEEEDDDDDEKEEVKLKDFVIQLLDYLSPDRDKNNSFNLSDSLIVSRHQHDDKFRFCPIPDFIYQTSSYFWKIFEEYRPLINDILLKKFQSNQMLEFPGIDGVIFNLSADQFSSRLVRNYPECFSFEFRSTFFRQQIHKDLDFINDIELEIRESNILDDSYQKLHNKPSEYWKSRIIISYTGNIGVDAGGLTKDWLTKLSIELLNRKLDLFEVCEKSQNFLPSRSLYAKSLEGLKKLRFAGKIVARALMQGFIIPIHLAKPFLKQILHRQSTIDQQDLEDADENLFESLEYYRAFNFDKNKEIEVCFEATDFSGETVELKRNGSRIKVNNKNKNEYISLMTNYRLIGSIKDQVSAFCDGFDSLIPHEKIRMFTPTELGLLICGIPKIDVEDLKNNTVYKEPYSADSAVVKLFFETIKKWDDENLAKLLVFITGTSRMPANGFAFFKQIDRPITIVQGGDSSRFPCAHTCINLLELPSYDTEDEMNTKLLIAISVRDFQIK